MNNRESKIIDFNTHFSPFCDNHHVPWLHNMFLNALDELDNRNNKIIYLLLLLKAVTNKS